MYDIIVVGAGAAGCTVARKLAEEKQKKVLIVEKKNHIAGNCYDVKDAHGVLVHMYGPHIFHTGKETIYEYLSRFTKWHEFHHEVVANVHGIYVPIPFNLHTLKAVYGEEEGAVLEAKLVSVYGMGTRVPILDLMHHEDADLQMIGKFVYDNIYVYYTMKQWGKKPEEIDPAVTARVPVNISYDNGYFADKYQGVPLHGFTGMFERMIDHANIAVRLCTEAKDVLKVSDGKLFFEGEKFEGQVIFTGPIDEFFDCEYGRLPYRTLDFAFEHYEKEDYQGHAVVNYTVDEAYTRITEYKYLTGQNCKGTTISKEYPGAYTGEKGQIPYYAIANEENHNLYAKYKAKAAQIENFHLLGRLAEYQYYNIDVMVEKAMELAESL